MTIYTSTIEHVVSVGAMRWKWGEEGKEKGIIEHQ
jgi:hypothetical protein